ncbi:MAG UNVERIFIED_CONTAM: HNH endonuclease [Microcystis novacekii LVE1205-3]|jgi:hypothetical protein
MEIHHITPKSLGGSNSYNNLQLLIDIAHDEKTANDGSLGNKSDCNSVKPEPPIPDNYIWVKGYPGNDGHAQIAKPRVS